MLRNLKKVLLSLIVVGALGSLTLHKVYAVFYTESLNAASSISDGTLTLENTVGTGTTCLSLSAATQDNANGICDQLFTDASLWFPGQVQTVNLTIKNSGSLNARTLEVWMPSCTQQTSTYVNGTRQNVPVVGGGDPCAAGGAEFYIQETQSDFTTDVQCWWPNNNASCGASSFGTIASFLAGGYTAAPGLRLWSYLVPNPSPALTATQTRYFTIGIELPANASNTLQGEAATFPFVWHMDS